MKWRFGRRSDNVQDKRSLGPAAAGGGAGLLVMAGVVALLGGDPTAFLLEGLSRSFTPSYESRFTQDQQNELVDYASVVLADTEDTWSDIFKNNHLGTYRAPTLVIFSGAIDSACGRASAAIGPFYCPADEKLYLDLNFFYELQARFGAPGDFAQAYVIAHEVGHHVQNLTGQLDKNQSNEQSVQTELQADCYAGVWAQGAESRYLLEVGDVDEAIQAASAVGDDRLQEQAQGYVVPDSFTHGSAAQRAEAFTRGYRSGEMQACTFGP